MNTIPTERRIDIVGFTSNTNGRQCFIHDCCGVHWVQDAPNRSEGQVFRLRLVTSDVTTGTHLAVYNIGNDGSDGCRVGFARRIYALTRGPALDGRLVRLIEVYHKNHDNTSKRADFHRNHGYATAEILLMEDETIKQEQGQNIKEEGGGDDRMEESMM